MVHTHTLPAEKDLEICRVLTGWDALEKRLGGPPVIDFNLPGFEDPEAADRYSARHEVLLDLIRLNNDPHVQAIPRLSFKLEAQEAYLRNLMGEHWDLTDYIQATMCFTPAPFTEKEIADQRQKVEEKLAALGIALDSNTEKNLHEADEEITEDETTTLYRDVMQRGLEHLSSIIGEIPEFDFDVGFMDVDAFWKNWVSG